MTRAQHPYLSKDDECYFIHVFASGGDPDGTHANSLINNFKKSPARKSNYYEWRHKGYAINRLASLYRELLPSVVDPRQVTIVPVPPSKTTTHPLYDDRLHEMLKAAFPTQVDIRKLVVCKEDREAAHIKGRTETRYTPQELYDNYMIDPAEIQPDVKRTIVIVDDMLTAGAHFKACERLLRENVQFDKIMGMFCARRELVSPFSAIDDFESLF